MRTTILGILLLVALPAPAMCAVLYKSIGANGVIEFSDTPPSDRSVVVESRTIGAHEATATVANASGDGMPLYDDGSLARANAQLDLAEHALAEALRAIGSPLKGMRLSAERPSNAQMQRVDFFRRNVTLARQNLMEVLRTRQAAPAVLDTVASR